MVSSRVNELTCDRNAGHTAAPAAILLWQQCRIRAGLMETLSEPVPLIGPLPKRTANCPRSPAVCGDGSGEFQASTPSLRHSRVYLVTLFPKEAKGKHFGFAKKSFFPFRPPNGPIYLTVQREKEELSPTVVLEMLAFFMHVCFFLEDSQEKNPR